MPEWVVVWNGGPLLPARPSRTAPVYQLGHETPRVSRTVPGGRVGRPYTGISNMPKALAMAALVADGLSLNAAAHQGGVSWGTARRWLLLLESMQTTTGGH